MVVILTATYVLRDLSEKLDNPLLCYFLSAEKINLSNCFFVLKNSLLGRRFPTPALDDVFSLSVTTCTVFIYSVCCVLYRDNHVVLL